MRVLLLLLVSLAALAPAAGASAADEWRDGVVMVYYNGWMGTGWWVAENTVVTAAHVVAGRVGGEVILVKGSWQARGVVIYANNMTDVAVIRAESMPVGAHVFPVATDIEEFRTVYVVGYPRELIDVAGIAASSKPRVAQGYITWYWPRQNVFEFQAITDVGNSGGPVVYENGAVAGVVSFAISVKVGTLYFARDANVIKEALDAAGVEYDTLEPPTPTAAVATVTGPTITPIIIFIFLTIIIAGVIVWIGR